MIRHDAKRIRQLLDEDAQLRTELAATYDPEERRELTDALNEVANSLWLAGYQPEPEF